MRTGAVIAAAGMSVRMEQFKQLMKIGNRTMAERVIVNFQKAGIREIAVVTGHRWEQMEKELRGFGVTFLKNRNFETTRMFESVKIGLEYMKDRCDRVFFCPADIPFFMVNTVEAMLGQDADVVQPVYGGKAGHPILLNSCLIPRILSYTGDGGLRGALRFIEAEAAEASEASGGLNGLRRKRIAVEDEAVLMDADTKAELQRLTDLHNARLIHPKAEVTLENCRPFFGRQTASLLRSIEKTGSVREACSELGISYSKGWSILNDAEDGAGCCLTERCPGGRYGGSARVTKRGMQLAELFDDYEKRVNQAAEDIFRQIFSGSELF